MQGARRKCKSSARLLGGRVDRACSGAARRQELCASAGGSARLLGGRGDRACPSAARLRGPHLLDALQGSMEWEGGTGSLKYFESGACLAS